MVLLTEESNIMWGNKVVKRMDFTSNYRIDSWQWGIQLVQAILRIICRHWPFLEGHILNGHFRNRFIGGTYRILDLWHSYAKKSHLNILNREIDFFNGPWLPIAKWWFTRGKPPTKARAMLRVDCVTEVWYMGWGLMPTEKWPKTIHVYFLHLNDLPKTWCFNLILSMYIYIYVWWYLIVYDFNWF